MKVDELEFEEGQVLVGVGDVTLSICSEARQEVLEDSLFWSPSWAQIKASPGTFEVGVISPHGHLTDTPFEVLKPYEETVDDEPIYAYVPKNVLDGILA